MKKIIMAAFVLAITIGAAEAQTTTQIHSGHHKREHKMHGFEKLNLTADQKAQLKIIHQDFKKQLSELKKQDQVTVAEMKNRRKELHQQFREKAESILTVDQKMKLEKMRTERKESSTESWRKNQTGKEFHRAAFFQKKLNLTGEQKDKIKEMRTDFKTQLEAIHNDQSLSDIQKNEKAKEVRKQEALQMKNVLTKEQMEKLQSLKKERKAKETK